MSTPPTTPMYDPAPGQPPRITLQRYRLLALFLGTWGVHNFAAGHTRKATIQLALGAGGLVLSVFLIGLPLLLGAFAWAIVDLATVTTDADGVPMDTAAEQARSERLTGSASPIPSSLPTSEAAAEPRTPAADTPAKTAAPAPTAKPTPRRTATPAAKAA